MSDSEENNKNLNTIVKDVSKANKIYSAVKGYGIALNPSKSTKVAIVQTFEKKSSSLRSVIRFDTPHKGANYNHVNLNHRVSGIRDPHSRLPLGAMQAAQGTAIVCKTLNTLNKYILYPLVILHELCDTFVAIKKDVGNKTTRNTVEKVTNLVGTTGGGYAGAATGGMIGTAILPGIGTVVGSLIGSITGTIGGRYSADVITKNVSDKYGYGIVKNECNFCGNQMEFKKYKGEKGNTYCDICGNSVYKLKSKL